MSQRSALLQSFRRDGGTLDESEAFREAAATLAAVAAEWHSCCSRATLLR